MQSQFKSVCASLAVAAGLLCGTALCVPPVYAQTPVTVQGLPDIADLVERLMPAVVEISVQANNPESGSSLSNPSNRFKEFLDEYLKRDPQGQDQSPKVPPGNDTVNAMGSGFIIDPKGLIVTNNHVIADAVNIQVHLHDGTVLKAELVGHDPKTDLALLRVKSDKPLSSISLGESDKTRIGQWVFAIGNPFGLGQSVSMGIISAKARDINSGPYDDFIQTDATINKGNSGGPLFDLNGNVIGINTAIFSPTGGSVGIGFAIPANEAKGVLDQLEKFGETRRGWLGVKLQSLTPDIAEGLNVGEKKGALIADVTDSGPAEKAGMKPGDLVINFAGREIVDSRSLRLIVASTAVGTDVDVTVFRDGNEVVLKIILGRLEEGEKLVQAQDKAKEEIPSKPIDILGMTLNDLNDDLRKKFKIDSQTKGVLISEVANEGIASDKGLNAGDVILDISNNPVTTAQEIAAAVEQALKDGKPTILALVAPQGNSKEARFVALKLMP